MTEREVEVEYWDIDLFKFFLWIGLTATFIWNILFSESGRVLVSIILGISGLAVALWFSLERKWMKKRIRFKETRKA